MLHKLSYAAYCWATLHLLSYAAHFWDKHHPSYSVSYLPSASENFKMPESGHFGFQSVRFLCGNKCWNRSGTGIKGPSSVPEWNDGCRWWHIGPDVDALLCQCKNQQRFDSFSLTVSQTNWLRDGLKKQACLDVLIDAHSIVPHSPSAMRCIRFQALQKFRQLPSPRYEFGS
jgi:hypothetical protein